MVEFFHALSDRYTYDLRRNHYIVFGIGWGLPIPLFSLGIHLYAQRMSWTLGETWSILSDHPVHLFFLLHPLFFGVVFGALGTLRRVRDLRIARVEQEKLLSEMEIAQEVQAQLYPCICPSMKTLDYSCMCRPADGLSGDYYDFLKLRPDQLCIAVGDISGKGISAALLMANLQALLRSRAHLGGDTLGSVVADMNRMMCSYTTESRYATFFCAVYDDVDRTLTYVNAGNHPPMLLRSGASRQDTVAYACDVLQTVSASQITRLESSGSPLGMFPEMFYRAETVYMNPGELLLVFTDGITEAMNAREEEFGEFRLANLASAHRHLPPSALIDVISAQMGAFVGQRIQHDDQTLIVAQVM
jgi:sigma-B regulation protein RsbU (phosphoserine phosphatase)